MVYMLVCIPTYILKPGESTKHHQSAQNACDRLVITVIGCRGRYGNRRRSWTVWSLSNLHPISRYVGERAKECSPHLTLHQKDYNTAVDQVSTHQADHTLDLIFGMGINIDLMTKDEAMVKSFYPWLSLDDKLIYAQPPRLMDPVGFHNALQVPIG